MFLSVRVRVAPPHYSCPKSLTPNGGGAKFFITNTESERKAAQHWAGLRGAGQGGSRGQHAPRGGWPWQEKERRRGSVHSAPHDHHKVSTWDFVGLYVTSLR